MSDKTEIYISPAMIEDGVAELERQYLTIMGGATKEDFRETVMAIYRAMIAKRRKPIAVGYVKNWNEPGCRESDICHPNDGKTTDFA